MPKRFSRINPLPVYLRNEPVICIPLEEKHLQSTYRIRNMPEVRNHFIISEPFSFSSHLHWYQCYLTDPNQYTWVIEHAEEIIAQFGLYNYDKTNNSIHFGRICIDPKFQSLGLGKSIILSILSALKNKTDINLVKLEVLSSNQRALNLYSKLGFKRHLEKSLSESISIIAMQKYLGQTRKHTS
jgi:RimJ/RimL family protein N-acetyltransferase